MLGLSLSVLQLVMVLVVAGFFEPVLSIALPAPDLMPTPAALVVILSTTLPTSTPTLLVVSVKFAPVVRPMLVAEDAELTPSVTVIGDHQGSPPSAICATADCRTALDAASDRLFAARAPDGDQSAASGGPSPTLPVAPRQARSTIGTAAAIAAFLVGFTVLLICAHFRTHFCTALRQCLSRVASKYNKPRVSSFPAQQPLSSLHHQGQSCSSILPPYPGPLVPPPAYRPTISSARSTGSQTLHDLHFTTSVPGQVPPMMPHTQTMTDLGALTEEPRVHISTQANDAVARPASLCAIPRTSNRLAASIPLHLL